MIQSEISVWIGEWQTDDIAFSAHPDGGIQHIHFGDTRLVFFTPEALRAFSAKLAAYVATIRYRDDAQQALALAEAAVVEASA